MNNQKNKVTMVFALFLLLGVAIWYVGVLGKTDKVYKKLSEIDGVISVERTEMDKVYGSCIKSKYVVTFSQPVDWDNPEAGTFPQRVEIGLSDKADVNFLELDGYAFDAGLMKTDYVGELVEMYKGNYIHVEHRFFGASSPDDLSYDETRYWENLTCENSAKDYHNIYSKLKSFLGDKWICHGASYGGLLTNVYAAYYPDDMNLYISSVAPCANGLEDRRFYDFIYTKIGDDAFGAQEGARLRSLVTQLQVDLIRNKKDLLPSYTDAIDKTGMRFRQSADTEILYDLNVLETAAAVWQYDQPFEELEQILSLPDDTNENHIRKVKAEFDLMISLQNPKDWSPDMFAWPYYVSAEMEIGNYYYDFSYLRKAIDDPEVLDNLSVTTDMEKTILRDTVFTREQNDSLTFKKGFREGLISMLKDTRARIVMIYGATDPWIALRLPDIENENINMFIHPSMSHSESISSFDEDTKNEITGIIDKSLKK